MIEAVFVAPDESKITETRDTLRQLADMDGRRDRGALLAILELERRAREKSLGSEFGTVFL